MPMIRPAIVAIAIALPAAPAAAEECAASFKPASTTGAMTAMTIYNFGEHWELQIDTPKQGALADVVVSIDGAAQPVFISGGLDDLLFVISTEESALQLSKAFRDAFAKGSKLTIAARDGGKPEMAAFPLKGSGAAVKRLDHGCK
jgi:hypothetical protein